MSKKLRTQKSKNNRNSRFPKIMLQGVNYDYENGELYFDTQSVVDALRKLLNATVKGTDPYMKLRPFLTSMDEILSEHAGLKSQKENIDKYISGMEDALQALELTIETDLEATDLLDKYENSARYLAYYNVARKQNRTVSSALTNSLICATSDLYGSGIKPTSVSMDDLRSMKQHLLAGGARLSPNWGMVAD